MWSNSQPEKVCSAFWMLNSVEKLYNKFSFKRESSVPSECLLCALARYSASVLGGWSWERLRGELRDGARGCMFPNLVGSFCFPVCDEDNSGRVEAQRSKKNTFPFGEVPVRCRTLLERKLTGRKKYLGSLWQKSEVWICKPYQRSKSPFSALVAWLEWLLFWLWDCASLHKGHREQDGMPGKSKHRQHTEPHQGAWGSSVVKLLFWCGDYNIWPPGP